MSATTTQTLPVQIQARGTPPSGPVTAELNFYQPPADGSKPWNYVEPQPDGKQNNFSFEARAVEISDMRGREASFSLDTQAFLPVLGDAAAKQAAASETTDWDSDESVRADYYPTVENLLLKTLPGSPRRVFIFDHTVRRALPGSNRAPVMRAHIDQTPESAAERVRLHMQGEAEELLQGRVRLVNVWRPINGAVESNPLAVADSASAPDSSLVAVEHRYPHRTGYTASVRHDDATRWWYWSGMDNDERLLLQCYDSQSGTRVPHSAFTDPRSTEASKPRESIEVRALIFG